MRRAAIALMGLVLLAAPTTAGAQDAYWSGIQAEASRLLQQYVRIDTSVPPGDVTKAADLLQGVLEKPLNLLL